MGPLLPTIRRRDKAFPEGSTSNEEAQQISFKIPAITQVLVRGRPNRPILSWLVD